MHSPRESWGIGRITLLLLLVVIVAGVSVVFVMHTVDQARERRERTALAGKWVLDGSNGEDYIVLDPDGSYTVHVSVYTGSIRDESWGVRDGRIFIPTQVKLTVGGPGSGDETAYGWYLKVRGDRLEASDGSLRGTFRRQ